MKAKIRRSIGYVALIVLAACVHHQPVDSFDTQPHFDNKHRDKTIAVIFSEPAIKDVYKTSSAGEVFYYENVYNVMEVAFKKKLGSAFKTVAVVKAAEPDQKYDFIIYPDLSVETVYDFWTYGCLIKFSLRINNSKGELVGQGKRELKRSFQVSGDKAFGIAMKDIFDPAVDSALATIR